MKAMAYVAIHQSIGLLKGIVRQPSNLIILKGQLTIYIQTLPSHTNISLGIVRKTLKFLVWHAADLESYLYVKNTAIYI